MTAAPVPPPSQAAFPRTAVRMTRIEGDLDAHKQVDDLRFNALAAAIAKLEASLEALQAEVREGFERLGASIQEIQLRLAGGDEPPGQTKGHWRIGPFGQWAIGLGALAALALIGWMAGQLWLEEPARIRAAQALDPPAAMRAR
ncbi:MAG TPA: hypothetical protein VN805_08235 [Caulobacteraceae bacterium]|nr:hypothetical protein [Caulobacteraceae bacterium]